MSKVLYGKEYQLNQLEKYRNRNNNHWKHRIGLAFTLVEKYARPRLREKAIRDIVVFDVGCSIGTFAIEFGRLGYRSYGVDFDPEALQIAKTVCNEEKVSAEFVLIDISDWPDNLPPIDIAICFDLFEHLHDDELGILLYYLRKQLSRQGSIVFHTFPTQYDYLFYSKKYLKFPLIPFRNLSVSKFNRIVKIYASLIDVGFLLNKGRTHKEYIKDSQHCNPLTEERLKDVLLRTGFNLLFMESSQIYPFQKSTQQLFWRQPVSYRNLYGVAEPMLM
ncbi:MAG: class I SAM-dependent methyltransferase [Candidatus Hodarchaeota archaeon]